MGPGKPTENPLVPRLLLAALLSLLTALVSGTTVARADGPFEPNETGMQAAGPLMGETIAAGLETPQDVDWFRFYAKPDSQVGILGVLSAACDSKVGSVRMSVYDADGSYGLSVASVTLGYTGATSPVTAGQAMFTSQAGHRYFVQVRQSLCPNAAYTLQVAPAQDLTTTLGDTVVCTKARRQAMTARRRLASLTRAVKRAHGVRRRTLKSRLALQKQAVVVAEANAKSSCTRRPLEGYPFT